MPDALRQVVVDSGPLIALFDAGDAHHRAALEFVRQTRAPLITSMAVITEAMYVLDQSWTAQRNLLAWISKGGLQRVEPETTDFERLEQLMEKYSDLPMDFTDAVVVALCESLDTRYVASVDNDFAIYRYKERTKFINLFFS